MSLTVLRFASVIFQETPSGADYLSKLLEHQYLLTKPLLRRRKKLSSCKVHLLVSMILEKLPLINFFNT